jgi:hypothetical protein
MKKEVVVPILNDEYKTIICWGNSKEVEKVLKSWHHKFDNVEQALANRRGVCFYSKNCHPIIALPKFPRTPAEIGTLAHEATHAVRNIFEKIEEECSDETFSHSVGAIVRKVLENK